jgi:hypothetical protein
MARHTRVIQSIKQDKPGVKANRRVQVNRQSRLLVMLLTGFDIVPLGWSATDDFLTNKKKKKKKYSKPILLYSNLNYSYTKMI